MVTINATDALVLITLLLCMPIQLWLHNSSSLDSRDGQVFGLVRDIHKTAQKYMSYHYWSNRFMFVLLGLHIHDEDILEYSRLSYEQQLQDNGECPAVEVLRYINPKGHFAGGTNQRRYRTQLVHYRVGDVISHKEYGVKGVIIGWDDKCKAPQEFLDAAHSKEAVTEICGSANYAVLVNIKDYYIKIPQYFPQKDLELVTDTKVSHPILWNYFTKFDGSRYLAQSWLAAMYPED